MKEKHSKYYKTILVMYFIIVAAYTLVLVGVFTYYSYNQFSTMNEKDMLVMTEQIKESVDQRLRMKESTTRQITDSENFSDVILNNTYLDKIIFQRDLNRIGGYFINQGCSITVLYGTGSNEAISPATIGKKQDFYTDMQFAPEEIIKIDEYILNGTVKDFFVAASNVNGEKRLTVFKKMRLYSAYNVIFCYSYSYDYILANTYAGNNGISIYHNGDILITNNDFEEEDNKKLALIAGELLKDGEAIKTSSAVFRRERCKIYAVSSEVCDWGYIMTVSDRERLSVIKRISLIAVFIFILAIGIGSFVIKQFTEMVYKPVRKLVNSAEIEKTDLDDEFAALKKAIDTGKSWYDELERYIQNNNEAKENFLKDILNSNFSAQDVRANMAKYSLGWIDGGCFIIIFAIANVTRLQKELGDINFYNVRDELCELLSDKINETMECETVRLNAERFAAVVKGTRNEGVEKYLIEQISHIEYRTSVEIKVFISDMVYKAEDIGKEYCRISEKTGASLMYSPAIVGYGGSQINKNMLYYPIELEKNLIENTLSGSKESVRLNIDRLFDENSSKEQPERDATQLIFAVNATVNRILQAINAPAETVFGGDIKLYNELALCRTDSDMKKLIAAVFMHLCEFVAKQNEEIGRDLAEEMLRFVDEHYQKEISLYDIAEKFNYSINYISRAFTRETGRNFKDYLSLVRVAKAKDLLRSGSYTVAQVTSMVGCTNANSFIRMFKRYEGITPGQYVESVKKE